MNSALVHAKPVAPYFGFSVALLIAAAIPAMGLSFPFMGGAVAPYEFLLAAAVGLTLLVKPREVPLLPLTQLLAILSVGLAVWILICNFVVRPFESVYMWEYRGSVIGTLLGFTAMYLCVTRLRIKNYVLICLGIGLAVKTGYYLFSGALNSGSRYIEKASMYDDYLIGYTAHGLYAAMGCVLCLSWCLRPHVELKWRITLGGLTAYFAWATLIFGNRSALAALTFVIPLFGLAAKRWSYWIKGTIAIGLGISLLAVFAPRVTMRALEYLPDSSTINDRFEKQDFTQSGEQRLLDWESIGILRNLSTAVLGVQWSEMVLNFQHLQHPHNIFLWMQVCGGIVATGLFLTISWVVFFAAVDISNARPGIRNIRLVWGLLVIYAVLLCNSWAPGIPVLLGLWLGLTMGEYEELRPKHPLPLIGGRGVNRIPGNSRKLLQCTRFF